MRRRTNDSGAALLATALLAVTPVGCTARVLAPSSNEPLHDRVRALENENRLLRQESDELRQVIAREQSSGSGALAPEVLANLPVPVQLFASFGSAVPTSEAPDAPIELAVHASSTDSRDRFVQLTGWVDLSIVTFTADPTQAVVLASRRFEPGEVRDSLRSGFFGLHYAFPIELPPAARAHASVVARVLYRDGFTGRELESVVQCPLRR